MNSRPRTKWTTTMSHSPQLKRIRSDQLLGRGVTAAYLTFNQAGVGSNPSDPTAGCRLETAAIGEEFYRHSCSLQPYICRLLRD